MITNSKISRGYTRAKITGVGKGFLDPDDEHMNDTLFVGDDCDEDNLEDSDEEN